MSNKSRFVVPIPPEKPEKPENPENKDLVLKTVWGCDFLGNRVPIDYYWVFMDEPMSFNNVHKLKLQKPEMEPESEQVSDVRIEFLVLPGDQINATPIKVKRQTGGVISGRNFSQQT